MSLDLPASARRVQDALSKLGVQCTVVELPGSTRSAAEAAAAVGCHVEQIAKSLVFRGMKTGKAILVIASGKNRVNEKHLGEQAGEEIGKADADFVREQTGFAIGGVPPIGHANAIRTFLDFDLLALTEIWAAAGTPHCVFQTTPEELVRITNGEVIGIT